MKLRRLGLLLMLGCVNAYAQSEAQPTETRIPGLQYRAGGVHKFFLGAHHRDLWALPVAVPILRLDNFAGGLTATKMGGGFQTKSLRFKSGDGRQFAFRSLDKDPSKVLPPDLRDTFVADIARDQISSAHPYAALVVPALAEAIGVLHAEPQLVIMPDDERLGQFRQQFAGLLGFIEERPADGPDGEPGFAGSDKIIGTDDLFNELEEDNDDYVDPQAYLKARLLDMLVGDWDRHADQWRWARFKREQKKVWYPIPRDRDQAFVKLDGFLPGFAEKRHGIRQLENYFKPKPDVISLTHSGRHTDRRFLTRLAWEDFQTVAAEVTSKVTNEVIARAVRQLPPAIYAVEGAELTQRLQARRDYLPQAAEQFYKLLAQHPEIVGSDKAEYVEVERRDNETVDVRIYKRDHQTGEKREALLFARTFKRRETHELRLYLLGGKDKVVLTGPAEKSILLRLIGGKGEDEVVDHSRARTLVYDTDSGMRVTNGSHTKFYAGKVDSISNFHENKPLLRDYSYDIVSVPSFAYNSDDGLFAGVGYVYQRYGFRQLPYAQKMSLVGNAALKTKAFHLDYNAYVVEAFGPLDWSMRVAVAREVRNFYGLGNITTRNLALEESDYYHVQSNEFVLETAWLKRMGKHSSLAVGGALNYFDTRLEDDSTLVYFMRPYGIDTPLSLQLRSTFVLDLRDRAVASSKGLYVGAGFSYAPRALELDSSFSKGYVDARFYVSPTRKLTLALHGWGAKVWGVFPYYEGVQLGGKRSLRGFRRERFLGDAGALGSAELRLALFRTKVLVPTEFGVYGFTDAGRVWWQGQSLEGWHTAAGGGIWFAPLVRTATFSIGAGSSVEGVRYSVGTGFAF